MIRTWLPLVFRALVVLNLALPALSRLLDYPGQVRFFAGLGLPAAPVLVAVVGAFEVVALVTILLGAAVRPASLPMVVIMFVAIRAAGPNLANVSVLVGSLGVILTGTGPYSLWTPEDRLLAWRGSRRS